MKSWIEISQSALEHNTQQIRSLLHEEVVFCAVVKANAYGHGLEEIVSMQSENGVNHFAVDNISEAIRVKKIAPNAEIFILGYTMHTDYAEVIRNSFIQVFYNYEDLKVLAELAQKLQKKARISLKIETGTHRQGIDASSLDTFLQFIKQNESIELTSIHSHFANAEDLENRDFTHTQIDTFSDIATHIFKRGLKPSFVHLACSAAAIHELHSQFNMVRIGIGQYGLWSSESSRKANLISKNSIQLKPVLTWKSVIAQIKDIKPGDSVGYACSFVADKSMRIAIIPVGYADGYTRTYAKNGHVLIHGRKCRILGIICMNMFMVDVSSIAKAQIGDTVTLLGRNGMNEITAEHLADISGTINYEVVTRISPLLPRKIV